MIKFNIFIFLPLITIFSATHCMITEFKYAPHICSPDFKTTAQRNLINQWIEEYPTANIDTSNIKQSIVIFRDATQEEQQGRCFYYAINKITGNTTILNIYVNPSWNNKKISTINISLCKLIKLYT